MSSIIDSVSIEIGSLLYGRFEDFANSFSHVLAEFIDNALQSARDNIEQLKRLDERYKLRVDIEIEWDITEKGTARKIIVKDNAGGIAENRYVYAFQPARTPEDNSGLNEFGMGLKTAACWLGKSWSVTTTAIGEDVERKLIFDLQKVTSNDLATLPVITKSVAEEEHYTVIEIWSPTKNVPSQKSLRNTKKELSSIYRQSLRNNEIEIVVCGESLSFSEYEILYAPFIPHPNHPPQGEPIYWKKEIDFKFGKYSAKGFVGILKSINQEQNGFVLLRRGRVVVGAETDGRYFPAFSGSSGTFRYKRLFGEIELEGFDVSFNKNDIQDKENLEALMEVVRSKIRTPDFDMIAQADNYRVDSTAIKVNKLVKKHNTAPKSKKKPIEVNVFDIQEIDSKSSNHNADVEQVEERKGNVYGSYSDNYKIGVENYTVNVVFVDEGNDLFWLDTSEEENNIIKCIVNSKHVFFTHFGQPSEAVVAILKTMAVAKYSAKKHGNDDTMTMIEFFNRLIKQTTI